jgi:hypothetical protein
LNFTWKQFTLIRRAELVRERRVRHWLGDASKAVDRSNLQPDLIAHFRFAAAKNRAGFHDQPDFFIAWGCRRINFHVCAPASMDKKTSRSK